MLLHILRMLLPLFSAILFCLWWGGLVFYAAIVVPIGSDVIGVTEQGAITARVTLWLNLLGTLNLITLALYLKFPKLLGKPYHEAFPVLTPSFGKSSLQLKGYALCALGLTQLMLWFLRAAMLLEFEPEEFKVHDADFFYWLHRLYLWVTILQMWLGLWWLALVVRIYPDDSGDLF